MPPVIRLAITVLAMLSLLLVACAQPAPTVAPTKPAAPAVATAAPAPPSAATAAPAAAAKPAAAAPTAAAPVAKIKRGGTLRAAQQGDWDSMDPHLVSGTVGYTAELVYDALLDYHMTPDGKFTLDPWLASSWEQKGREYTFKLEKGAKFHDGTDVNAEAIKFNFERMRDNKKSRLRATFSSIDSVEAVDPLTVKVTLKAPWAAFPSLLTVYPSDTKAYIVSKAAVEKYGDDFGTRPENSIGSGPMKVASWLKSSQQELERFEGYWKMGVDGKPLPYYDKATFRFIVDTSVSMIEMKSGNLDFIERIDGRDVPAVKANPALSFHELTWDGTIYSLGVDPSVEPFSKSKQLRQALHFAVDRETVGKVIGEGIGVSQDYWWSPGTLGYDAGLPKYTYDVNKAKQLLTEGGFASGVDITLSVVARPQDQRMGEVLKQMWDAVGLRTKLDSMERIAYFERAASHKLQIITFRAHLHPDPDMMSTQMVTDAPANWFNWSDPNMDKCMLDGRVELDTNKRADIYKRCQRILFDEGVYAPIFNWKHNDVTSAQVMGWEDNWEWPRFKRLWLNR